MQQRDLFNRGQIIQNKINNHTISQLDIKELNGIDESITLGCLSAERSLKNNLGITSIVSYSSHIHTVCTTLELCQD